MTLETFLAGAAFRATGFGAALRALEVDFGLAAFLAAAFTGFLARGREGDFAALARLAFGLAVVAFATLFAVLDPARFVFERAADRRKPFARLLLMGLISKGCSLCVSSRRKRRELNTAALLNQRRQVFAGALSSSVRAMSVRRYKQRKILMALVCYAKVRLAYDEASRLLTLQVFPPPAFKKESHNGRYTDPVA